MKIEILRSVMISGEPAKAGSTIEVSAADANLLIGMNKAQAAPEPEPALKPEAPKQGRKSPPTPKEA